MKMSFIVFEGIDGCGKSTQALLFHNRFISDSKFNHVLFTREPYNSKEIRRRLAEEDNPYSNARLMADLYVKDRRKHLDNFVIPNLKKGIHVISDRFKMSTIAYQTTQGMDMDELIKRHNDFLVPDITFLIDVPVYIAFERSEGKEKKFEGNRDFQEKLRDNYFRARSKLLSSGENVCLVEGNKSIDEVSDYIWNCFVKKLNGNFEKDNPN